MRKKRILYVCSEMNPFLKISSVADIARILPEKIQQKDNEIRVLMPRFGLINERRNRLHEVVRLSGINITIDDNDNPLIIKVASIPEAKMQVYFLDNEDYFHRKFAFKGEDEVFFKDNDERTIFFCKGALETVKKLGWAPDIIHCHGWMTSLIPLYIKTLYKDEPVFKAAKVVYSVFENQFDETMGKEFARKASLNSLDADQVSLYENADCPMLYKAAANFSDGLVLHDLADPDVTKFTGKLSLPTMQHSDDELADTYSNFYDEILSKN
jgi:starch synthase